MNISTILLWTKRKNPLKTDNLKFKLPFYLVITINILVGLLILGNRALQQKSYLKIFELKHLNKSFFISFLDRQFSPWFKWRKCVCVKERERGFDASWIDIQCMFDIGRRGEEKVVEDPHLIILDSSKILPK